MANFDTTVIAPASYYYLVNDQYGYGSHNTLFINIKRARRSERLTIYPTLTKLIESFPSNVVGFNKLKKLYDDAAENHNARRQFVNLVNKKCNTKH